MKREAFPLILVAVVALTASCMSKPVALSVIGPEPGGVKHGDAAGRLQVFSATEKSLPFASDDPVTFNFHSGYDIYDAKGKNVRFVPNHLSEMDEWPDQVDIPAGRYTVVAQSTCCGLVRVPVIISSGRTTVVHLDGNWFPGSGAQLVYLPTGAAAGWSGSGVD